MCGIFGAIGPDLNRDIKAVRRIAMRARRRGNDSSGLLLYSDSLFRVMRADRALENLLKDLDLAGVPCVMGHGRLITNGESDNQPVLRDGIVTLHNGIILNESEIWDFLAGSPTLHIDTEVMPALINHFLLEGLTEIQAVTAMLEKCKGSISAVFLFPQTGKLVLCSNTGSLFFGFKGRNIFFASEMHSLKTIACTRVAQVKDAVEFKVPTNDSRPQVSETRELRRSILPALQHNPQQERLLLTPDYHLQRCSKCILPETMPFISFGAGGVCIYCENYVPRVVENRNEALSTMLESYLSQDENHRVIFPFSGGRDSSFGLHYLVNELGIKPVTYTYDWGMLTDLGRRNISLMCAQLGVENIVVAADIPRKRENIRKNLQAWLRQPHLGMVNLLTAGDKHFFQHILTLKKELTSSMNVWSFNPLETTHFKTGFLGVPPSFSDQKVYKTGIGPQISYQRKRFAVMAKNFRYLNASLWDTLGGEYFRSVAKQSDLVQLFDFVPWEEKKVDDVLADFGWEKASDTKTTWRIGDGTAAFYNYVFYVMAGFTEHDTFRSNQIREGQISRSNALQHVHDENRPRYENIRWYLDAIGLDFETVIARVNSEALAGHGGRQ